MTDSLPAPPELDPASLAASEFTRARRGLEATEVRAALGRAADALRAWSERDARMRELIAEMEQRLDESHELDEQRIATVLGEETARIVTAARDAANEIREKAQEQAERLIRESEETATAAAEALRGEAQALRDDAAKLRSSAAEEAEATRSAANEDAERVRADADADAATQREEAAALATSTVSDAQSRADELLGKAELILSERSAEAEAAATEITTAAEESATAVEAAATRTRDEAEQYASGLRSEAEQAAAAVVLDAESKAEAVIEDATAQGRAMVAEARAVRERMLRDLVEKRHAARRQLEGALAGRDRIIEVLRSAGEEVVSTIGLLDAADGDASVAAEDAALAVDAQIDFEAEIESLRDGLVEQADERFIADRSDAASSGVAVVPTGVGEVSSRVDEAHEGTPSDDPRERVATPRVASVPVAPVEQVGSVRSTEKVGSSATDGTAGLDVLDGGVDPDDEITPAQEAAEELASEHDSHDDVPEHDADATVHDLFARIRAEGLEEPDEPVGSDAGTRTGVERSGEAAAETAAPDSTAGVPGATADPAAATAGVPGAEDASGAAAAASPESVQSEGDEAVVVDLTALTGPEQMLDRRDGVLVPIEKGLARALKRVASDEQNEILDRLRRVKRGRPDPSAILPSDDPGPFVDALGPEFARAVDAGAAFWSELVGGGVAVDASDDLLSATLSDRVTQFLALHRAHLDRTFSEADEAAEDTAELGDRVRAAYRDWRSGSLSDLAGDLATAGFALGERLAAGDGTPWRWVVDHGGLPCADGEDNALAGDVACGEPFPTGDVLPPAHPGCRCMLAPAAR